MRAKFGRDPMAGSKKVTLKFIIGWRSKIHTIYCFKSHFSRVLKVFRIVCDFRKHLRGIKTYVNYILPV